MVKVIMGPKGTGKTKRMIELVNEAAKSEAGNVICIERGPKLTYDIDYSVRLVEAGHYDLSDFHFLKGFLSGLYAGNFDISHVFIDSLYKIVPFTNDNEADEFFGWLDNFSNENNIRFTIMITGDAATVSEGVKKFF